MYNSIFIDEFYQKNNKEKLTILDVREVDEYESGHIKSSTNMPLSELVEIFKNLDKKQEYYVICHSGGRSANACTLLSNEGYNVVNVMGGISAWRGDVV